MPPATTPNYGWQTISPTDIAYSRGKPRDLRLSGRSGCYALYGDGHLLYIGSAVDLDLRLTSHIREQRMLEPGYAQVGGRYGPRIPVAQWSIKYRFSRFYGEWATRELRLIRRLRPPMNCVSRGCP